ncbi:hypothetical protein APZ00_14025 [Pannonibacter phragmitetus]|uniref:Uncharacterized protein n=1 Tax=Pannonibacter phragmitetus TaxID=121719 RepID=A0A0U3PKC9_9HYPH|nr:hypothetical protein APZ00_14025 [Pannonibacter phragmitetus]
MPESLSPLERELLGYVERLMNALSSGTAQFEALEKRSTDMIENRQAALEGSLKSLIASQATFMNVWLASGNLSIDTASIELTEAFALLEQAEAMLETVAPLT